MDKTLGKELTKTLKKEGFKFSLKHIVKEVINTGNGVKVIADDKKGKKVTFEGDYCLVAVGRKPYTKGLGLENIGVKTDELGRIEVDNSLQTNIKNIYAIGDVIKGPMLAHKAEEEGVFVVENIKGQNPHINYNLIPGVIYTWPEVAAVGQTEKQVMESGREYNVGQFPIRALGRARASMDIMGTVKIISDKKTDEVLGVHIIAPRAADLIMEAVVAMEFRASAEDLARICHPHPTYSEAIKEAALSATADRPLHI
jgi:dihydrolipoamide dehydrogenase